MKSKLNEYLEFYNITQKELADSLGINRNAIGRYCNNTFESISKNHLDLLCSFFRCSFDELFDIDYNIPIQYPSSVMQCSIYTIPFPKKDNKTDIITDIDESSKLKTTLTREKPLLSENTLQIIDKMKEDTNDSNKQILPSKIEEQIETEIQKHFEDKIYKVIEQQAKEYITDILVKAFGKYTNIEAKQSSNDSNPKLQFKDDIIEEIKLTRNNIKANQKD